jgi:hypothetical protein
LDRDSVAFTGKVITELAASRLRLTVNGSRVVLRARQGDGYPFVMPEMPLSYGDNRFRVRIDSTHGSDERTLGITRRPDNPDSLPAPGVTVLSPNAGQWISGDTVEVVGRVQSRAGLAGVTVNGQSVQVVGDNIGGSFSRQLGVDGDTERLEITVAATDRLGRTTTESLSVNRDATGPEISLANDLAPAPADNAVTETPLRLTGTVTDARLAGMLVNGRSPSLEPTDTAGQYRFDTEVPLSGGTRTVSLLARDDAGNTTKKQYQLTLDPSALLKPLVPAHGARFVTRDEPVTIDVAARLAGTADGASARAVVDGQDFPLSLNGTAIEGTATLPADAGRTTLRFEVNHPDHGEIAATSITVEVQNRANQSLRLTRMEPALNSTDVDPNQLVTFYFNKAVDPEKLDIAVRETLHGPTYVNDDPPGADFLRADGYEIVQVNRDRDPVGGTLDPVPGNRAISFKPDRFFGYGSRVYVRVRYDGEVLDRGSFQVAEVPTQLNGMVMDQFGEPVPDVPVRLGERTTVTDDQGGFAFGFKDNAPDLEGGNRELVLNPDGEDPRLGTRYRTVYVEPRRFTRLGANVLPLINENTGRDVVQSGITTSLANNRVELDLTNAGIRDRRDRDSVMVNVQTFDPARLGFEQRGAAAPFGVYGLQPEHIRVVSGRPELRLPVPELDGLDAEFGAGDTFLVMGLDEQRKALTPVAAAEVEQGRVVTRGGWHGRWLDYFALAPVPASAGQAVNNYINNNGEWTSVRRAMGLE